MTDEAPIVEKLTRRAKALDAFNRHLIDDWKTELERLLSLRVAALWIVIGSIIFVAPMISDEAKSLIGAGPFAGGLLIASISFGIARLVKQPGTDQ